MRTAHCPVLLITFLSLEKHIQRGSVVRHGWLCCSAVNEKQNTRVFVVHSTDSVFNLRIANEFYPSIAKEFVWAFESLERRHLFLFFLLVGVESLKKRGIPKLDQNQKVPIPVLPSSTGAINGCVTQKRKEFGIDAQPLRVFAVRYHKLLAFLWSAELPCSRWLVHG